MSAASSQWYWVQNGRQEGPVTWDALQSLARCGKLRPTDLVLREGKTAWQPANTARDNEALSPAAPPPIAPPIASATAAPVAPVLPPGLSATPSITPAPDEECDSDAPASTVNVPRFLGGLLLCGLGIAATAAGYMSAASNGSGRYTIFYGAVIWGLVLVSQSFGKHANNPRAQWFRRPQ